MHRPSSNQKLAVFLDQLPSTAALVLLDQVLQKNWEKGREMKKKNYIRNKKYFVYPRTGIDSASMFTG